ncbi:MAG TPA: hypothetical protein VMT17_14715 [Anaeromyxobacteraceae bacterium]|nr:hypothetical protein [Anaeromyxobacteraceae bacterium]
MAATLRYFMLPEDERSLFRHLAPHGLTLYPEVFPQGTRGVAADEAAQRVLDGDAYYLAAERLGPVIVRPLKRGRDKGLLEIAEIPSPVFHYERSHPNDEGELVGGRLWAELDVTDSPEAKGLGKPLALRRIFEDVHQFFRKSWRRSDPKGWWVGPAAAARVKAGDLVLREPGHKGRTVAVWR